MKENKVDLHIHTDRNSQTGKTTSIASLLKKLNQENVTLASITNHRKFDYKEYKDLSKGEIHFIPGIELDIKTDSSNDYKQLILYSNNILLMDSFNEIKTKDWPISLEDLIERIKNSRELVLLSLHYRKDSKRSFKLDEAEKIKNKLSDLCLHNIFIMLETTKLSTADPHGKTGFHITAFSDGNNWVTYPENPLPNVQDVKSLEEYIRTFVLSKTNASFVTDKKNSNNFYNLGNGYGNKDIPLSTGLNVIFGPKGSGKSHLLDTFDKMRKNSDGKQDKFDYISFGQFQNIKNLSELCDKWVEDVKGELGKIVNEQFVEMLKPIYFNYEEQDLSNFNMSTFRKNYDASERNADTRIIMDKLKCGSANSVLNDILDENEILEIHKIYLEIHENLLQILDYLTLKEYQGKIKPSSILKLMKQNICDWIKNINFNYEKFISVFHHNVDTKLQVKTIKPKIGLVNWASIWSSRTTKNINVFISIDSSIQSDNCPKKTSLIESTILDPKQKYSLYLETKLRIKTSERVSYDTSEFPSKVREAEFRFYNGIKGGKFDDLIEKYNLSSISVSDIYNIYIISQFGRKSNYIPSTGQMDMLMLDNKLMVKSKNLLIDEFCNSLDNEYVFSNLVDKMNNHDGRILASTHNSIISVLTNVSNYFYTTVEDNSYRVFFTMDGLNGLMCNLNDENKNDDKETLKTVLKIIEGGKIGFVNRGVKYGTN